MRGASPGPCWKKLVGDVLTPRLAAESIPMGVCHAPGSELGVAARFAFIVSPGGLDDTRLQTRSSPQTCGSRNLWRSGKLFGLAGGGVLADCSELVAGLDGIRVHERSRSKQVFVGCSFLQLLSWSFGVT